MSRVEEAQKLVASLTPGERAEVLQMVVRDLGHSFPGIDTVPGLAGGSACVARSRIPVWILESSRRLGASESEILSSYPSLRAEDLANAWAYVRAHRDEIDREIVENDAA